MLQLLTHSYAHYSANTLHIHIHREYAYKMHNLKLLNCREEEKDDQVLVLV